LIDYKKNKVNLKVFACIIFRLGLRTLELSTAVDKDVNNMSQTNWHIIQDKIRNKIGELNYLKWFTFTRLISEVPPEVIVAVPDNFFQDWLEEHYIKLIEQEYTALLGSSISVRVKIDERLADEMDKKISEESPQAGAQVQGIRTNSSGLNPKYTFDRFVVGNSSQLAHAAAKAVADLPGGHYNPLFIYGGVGLGKTHLASAIGLEILKNHPATRVLYVTSESFMNEVVFGIRYDKMVDLRKKYRSNCDVLLMDDIQFLGGKERTQEEFFHTFNTLVEIQKQIVVTSDRYPKDIMDMDDRIRNRLEWGLIADIQPPDLETRIAILKKKAEGTKIFLPDDVAIYLATMIRSNIRELEGALIRLSAYSSLFTSKITVPFAEKILSNLVNKHTAICSIDSIQKLVSDYYKIKISEMKSHRRMKSLVVPRQIAMFLCKKHAGSSFPEIGEKFGGKDHTTAIHAVRKIEAEIMKNPKMKDDVEFLEKRLTLP